MIDLYLRIFFISVLIRSSTGQPVFDCPKHVVFGDSAELTCSNVGNNLNFLNPNEESVGACTKNTCESEQGFEEKINITYMVNKIILTVFEIDKRDGGEWTCVTKGTVSCFLNAFKLPSCEISSTHSTNDLSLGQDLSLNINLTDYYCTNNIVWDLTIRDQSQNVTGFRDFEETDDIRSRIIAYSPTVTSSLTGRVELTFNCNDETYDVSCSGVKELQLRDPPSCNLSTDDDTDDMTVGNNLTLEVDIEEYPCTTGIKYALISGSVMIAEFVKNANSFYATFEVKHDYLDKQLQLKYTCNSVSATTRTEGVTILRTKDDEFQELQVISPWVLGIAIGLPVGVILIVMLGILTWYLTNHRSSSNETPFYDIPSYGMNAEVQYQDLIRGDGTPPGDPDTQNVPDVEYETPDTQNVPDVEDETPDTHTAPNSQYESIDDIEQANSMERRTRWNQPQYSNVDSLSQDNGNQEYLSAVCERT